MSFGCPASPGNDWQLTLHMAALIVLAALALLATLDILAAQALNRYFVVLFHDMLASDYTMGQTVENNKLVYPENLNNS